MYEFISEKEKKLILHCINIYLEKLDFIFKNCKFYNIDNFTISLLKDDYNNLVNLRSKISLIEI